MTGWRVDQAELRGMVKACAADREMPARVLAAALDVKTEVVHALLAGNRQWWYEAVETMADLFEMSVDELVGDGVTPKRRADIKRGRQARAIPASEVVKGKVRALCCACGTMRRIDVADLRRDQADPARQSPGEVSLSLRWHTVDRLTGRAMNLAECATCQVERPHAVIVDNLTKEQATRTEASQQHRQSADDKARIERDDLVRRMEGFGVEIHWRPIGTDPRWLEKHGAPAIIGGEWDESKSVWWVEINPQYPPSIQLGPLRKLWKAIALDEDDYWPTSREQGAWVPLHQRAVETALDGLIDEIHNAAPAVLTSIVLDTNDREVNS